MKKKISIICPAYNSEKYISSAIKSILNQSFRDFEFIIIVDPSSDNTLQQIKRFKDSRILLIINKRRLGLAASLNLGIKKSTCELIARVDSDDVYLKNRLKKQYDYMKKNPQIDLVGTNAIIKDGKDVKKLFQPLSNNLIKWAMNFRCPFLHPTIMIRKKIFTKYTFYPLKKYEDYHFYLKIIDKIKSANMRDFLCIIRKHENNLSILKNNDDLKENAKIFRECIRNFYGYRLNDEMLEMLIYGNSSNHNSKTIYKTILVLKSMRSKFIEKFPEEKKSINIDVVLKIIIICLKNKSFYNLCANIIYFFRLDKFFFYHFLLKLFNRYILKNIT